jgi:hypothetical protein
MKTFFRRVLTFVFFNRQRNTRHATMMSRRPIAETNDAVDLEETQGQPSLSGKEEKQTHKLSEFMQKYQEFKKTKGKYELYILSAIFVPETTSMTLRACGILLFVDMVILSICLLCRTKKGG